MNSVKRSNSFDRNVFFNTNFEGYAANAPLRAQMRASLWVSLCEMSPVQPHRLLVKHRAQFEQLAALREANYQKALRQIEARRAAGEVIEDEDD